MPIRKEERECAEILQVWLEQLGLRTTWQPVDQDPPDLSFIITPEHTAEECWGVEVTGLFQYADWDGKESNRNNIEAPIERLCERLKSQLPPSTTTGYVIFGSGPHEADLPKIESRALEHIRSGRTDQEFLDFPESFATFEHILKKNPGDPRLSASVEKMAKEHSRFSIAAITKPIQVVWGAMLDGSARIPGTDKMLADINATLEYALERILKKKLPRLKKLTGYRRKLLVVWNSYYFADATRVKEILDSYSLSDQEVDSIFFVDDSSTLHLVADPAGLFGPHRRYTHDHVAALAYQLWERRARPIGSPEVDWFEAERQLGNLKT